MGPQMKATVESQLTKTSMTFPSWSIPSRNLDTLCILRCCRCEARRASTPLIVSSTSFREHPWNSRRCLSVRLAAKLATAIWKAALTDSGTREVAISGERLPVEQAPSTKARAMRLWREAVKPTWKGGIKAGRCSCWRCPGTHPSSAHLTNARGSFTPTVIGPFAAQPPLRLGLESLTKLAQEENAAPLP